MGWIKVKLINQAAKCFVNFSFVKFVETHFYKIKVSIIIIKI